MDLRRHTSHNASRRSRTATESCLQSSKKDLITSGSLTGGPQNFLYWLALSGPLTDATSLSHEHQPVWASWSAVAGVWLSTGVYPVGLCRVRRVSLLSSPLMTITGQFTWRGLTWQVGQWRGSAGSSSAVRLMAASLRLFSICCFFFPLRSCSFI